MSDLLDNVLSRLEGVKQQGRYYMALCPKHEDNNRSLCISTGDDGKILLKCYAGCDTEAVVEAIGLRMSDLFPDSGNGNGQRPRPKAQAKPKTKTESKAGTDRSKYDLIESYFYHDTTGKRLFKVDRMVDRETGDKQFPVYRPNGKDGWIPGLGKVEPVAPVPYHLPLLVDAVKAGKTIYIPEGEKDVHTLEALGFTATTSPFGAGKWHASYSAYLKGVPVVIFEDNDGPGRDHAQDVAAKTYGLAASVKVVSFPDLPQKGDVSDWIQTGHTKEELLARVATTPEWKPEEPEATSRILSLSDLLTGQLEPVCWTVENLIPTGGISALAGDSGVGKSWVGYNLALCVSAGVRFLGHFDTQVCPVMFFDAENGEALIRRRVKKLFTGLAVDGNSLPCDLPFRVYPGPLRVDDSKLAEWLIRFLQAEGIRLVIADPLIHCLPEGTSENDSVSTAAFFTEVRKVQAETGCAFVFTHHSRKRSHLGSSEAGQMLRGSSAIRGVLDSHLFLRKLPSGSLLAEHDKSRHAEPQASFIITISDTKDGAGTVVNYGGEAEVSCDQTAIASAFITRVLTDAGGTLKRQDILDMAKGEGLKERTAIRALSEAVEARTLTKTKDGKEAVYTLRIQEDLWQE